MAAIVSTKVSVAAKSLPSSRTPAPVHVSRNVRTSASVKEGIELSRREALATSVATLSLLISSSPAYAFLGFGEDDQVQAKYQEDTAHILASVNRVLAIPKDDEGKEDAIKELRKEINNWVATYRREQRVSGKPSYGNTYSALNALAGHFNSFGLTAPIPKKRLDRLTKELADAEALLSRGR